MTFPSTSGRAEPVGDADGTGQEAVHLLCHAATPAPRIEFLHVAIERRSEHQLWLRYHLEMPLDALVLPGPAAPERADNLWQTTCFELFLRRPGQPAYAEFNFSPSGRWAAYRFDDVREGMAPLAVQFAPDGGIDASDGHFALETTLILPSEWRDGALDIALSAVIETTDGSKSYWALAHPADKPDFHHPGSFTLRLPAP